MITSLQHIAFGIPEMKAGTDFYETFGLETVDRPDHVAMRCFGRAQDQIVLIETGQRRKLAYFSLGTTPAGLAEIEGRLAEKRIDLLDPPLKGAPGGIWFRDPEGTLVNVQVAEAAPWRVEAAAPRINRPGLTERLGEKGCPPFDIKPVPRRMGHFILFAKDVFAQSAFYCSVLGFRLSDRIVDGYAAFMRTPGDADHHVLALLKSEAPGFHHASFEMGGIDEAEVAATRLFAKGYRHAWGPGRHGVGSNYFHYFRDPWNGMAEYFYDMDFVPADCPWEAQEWTKKDGMFLWSADGPPPPDFGKNYEIAD
ncbi:VOC family protein [Sphingomonas canadensis]|uniref:VOC family protein n=1 Tax=Sphingomonas canadensis TaxID=1219257 RepID=A0ABW3HA37_9SPHN|nr:VOC family protein [Sphingomonas canadensis]MCW3838130.1 VOC family protein [Sphingomonas canadensis]